LWGFVLDLVFTSQRVKNWPS